MSHSPNVRHQDGLTEYMLCHSCEGKFSKWERSFARIFRKHYDRPGDNIDYSADDALAALSILWRVAAHCIAHPENNHLELGNDYSRIMGGFEAWRSVLLGEHQHPGKFRTFWLFMDYATGRDAADSGFNRHVFHATNFDLLASQRRSFVLVHLPGMYLIGALEDSPRNTFRGVDISYKGGRYISKEKKIVADFVLDNINKAIIQTHEAFDTMSNRQHEKILQDVLSNPEAVISSKLFRTHLHDRRQH